MSVRRTKFAGTITSLKATLASKRTDLLGHCARRMLLLCSDSSTNIETTLHTVPVLERTNISSEIMGLGPRGSPSRFVGTLKTRRFRGHLRRTVSDFVFHVRVTRQRFPVRRPRKRGHFFRQYTRVLLRLSSRLREGLCVRTVMGSCEDDKVDIRGLGGEIKTLTVGKAPTRREVRPGPIKTNRRGGGRDTTRGTRGLVLA